MLISSQRKLVAEFLEREDIFHRFEYFLEVKELDPFKAREIVRNLTQKKTPGVIIHERDNSTTKEA